MHLTLLLLVVLMVISLLAYGNVWTVIDAIGEGVARLCLLLLWILFVIALHAPLAVLLWAPDVFNRREALTLLAPALIFWGWYATKKGWMV